MKVKYLGVLLLALLSLYGCDDNTGTLGMDMLPDSDGISAKTETFDVSTKSMLADKVYSKTSTGYIGKFTDPDPKGFGNYEASFLAELNCTENFTFPAVYEESADGKSGKGERRSGENPVSSLLFQLVRRLLKCMQNECIRIERRMAESA
mgnify:CR=1 FL=1